MNSRTTSALALRGLTKTYAAGGSGERPALAPLTLDVEPGQLVALVGHNGSGKTTMLKMVAGLLDPSGGVLRAVEGHRLAQAQGRAGVFRDYRLRVASVLRDYGMEQRDQAPADSRAAHG